MDEASATIAAAPERVWELISDPTRMGEFSPSNTGGRWILGADGLEGIQRTLAAVKARAEQPAAPTA